MTAPYPDEAVRAVAEALKKHLPTYRVDGWPGQEVAVMDEDCPGGCGWETHDAGYPDRHLADVALTAAMPVLAEHFAQAVGAMPVVADAYIDFQRQYTKAAARVIRAAATPTEEASPEAVAVVERCVLCHAARVVPSVCMETAIDLTRSVKPEDQ